MEEYGLEEGLILTMDDEEVLRMEGKDGQKIIVVNLRGSGCWSNLPFVVQKFQLFGFFDVP